MPPTNAGGSTTEYGMTLYWRHRNQELWVYDSRPEVGINAGTSPDVYSRVRNQLHMRLLRVTMYWSLVEPSAPGVYDPGQLAFWDDAVARAAAAGIELVLLVSVGAWDPGTPVDSNLPGGVSSATPESRAAAYARFGQFVGSMAQRYPSVRFWELWNEWDVGAFTNLFGGNNAAVSFDERGARYAEMLGVTYPALKSANPNSWALVGGMASASAVSQVVQGIYNGGGRDRFDFLALHTYGRPIFPDSAAPQPSQSPFVVYAGNVFQALAANDDAGRPLWNTEFGQQADDILFGYGYRGSCPGTPQDNAAFVDAKHREQWQRCLDYSAGNTLYTKVLPYALQGGNETPPLTCSP